MKSSPYVKPYVSVFILHLIAFSHLAISAKKKAPNHFVYEILRLKTSHENLAKWCFDNFFCATKIRGSTGLSGLNFFAKITQIFSRFCVLLDKDQRIRVFSRLSYCRARQARQARTPGYKTRIDIIGSFFRFFKTLFGLVVSKCAFSSLFTIRKKGSRSGMKAGDQSKQHFWRHYCDSCLPGPLFGPSSSLKGLFQSFFSARKSA